jgi:carbon-monoxide dehydrogenase large subunit
MPSSLTSTFTGQPMKRMEDERLLRGAGTFIADLDTPGMLHMAVVRSTEAHARIVAIDASAATACAGVVAVVTGTDLAGSMPALEVMRRPGSNSVPGAEHPILATRKAMYIGQPLAFVVADSAAVAEDAVELVSVGYDTLPAVVDPHEPSPAGMPPIHDGFDDNVAMRTTVAMGDPAKAFAEADRVVKGSYWVPRLSPAPAEGRGALAYFNDTEGRMQVWTSTQASHEIRAQLAHLLGDTVPDIHVVSLDVGGGFGQKHHLYPDEAGVVVMAQRLGKPVRWIESRRENFVASQARGYAGDIEAAVRSDGQILGMRARMVADMGAYQIHGSLLSPDISAKRITGPYDIHHMDMEMVGVMTNKPPVGPYRGAGQPESSIMMEQIIDRIAVELELDPVEVRLANLIHPEQMPYTTVGGIAIDDGNYPHAFARSLETARYADWRTEQTRRRADGDGKLIGIGVATTASGSGGSGGDAARSSYCRVTVDETGHVWLDSDISPHGQGMATSFAQLVADELGVDPASITLRTGDTDLSKPYGPGTGTYASRSLVIGGSAAVHASRTTRDLLATVAAQAMECDEPTVWIAGGVVRTTADTSRAMAIGEVAALAQRGRLATDSGSLEVEHIFTIPSSAFTFAAHTVVVEIDRATGELTIPEYVAAHDCGVAVNPLIVHGQIAGGVAQGAGEALVEVIDHDSNGIPSATSYMDYAVFSAEDMPRIGVELLETPSKLTPTGMRGVGEAPSVASPAAIANAVMDALRPLGVRHLDMPFTPERIWSAIANAR